VICLQDDWYGLIVDEMLDVIDIPVAGIEHPTAASGEVPGEPRVGVFARPSARARVSEFPFSSIPLSRARGERWRTRKRGRDQKTGSGFGVWGRGGIPNGIRPLIFQPQKSYPA
jgi:hypothetical protein